MDTLGKFVLGAVAGVATLGAIAGIYCKFFSGDTSDSDSFAELEKQAPDSPNECVESDLQTA